MDDRDLLQLLRTQPEDGLWQLTQKYGALIRAVVGRILPGDPQDAEECAADTLVRIWNDRDTLQLQGDTLRGFVIWAARNMAIDRYRRLRREKQMTADGDDELMSLLPAPGSTAGQAEQSEAISRTQDIIRAMPPPDDEIFLRRFFLCESVPQIAKRLNMNIKAVESRLQRGKKKLRESLTKEGVTLG